MPADDMTMNDDSFYVDEMHDDSTDRVYFKCEACPLHDNCSRASWAKVNKCSFWGEHVVRQSVSEHLQHSSLHYLSTSEVADLVQNFDITEHTETFEERQAYRKAVDANRGKKAQHQQDQKMLPRRPKEHQQEQEHVAKTKVYGKGKDGDKGGGKSKDGGKDGGKPQRGRASSRSFAPSPERREPHSEAIARAACRSASATGVFDDRRSEIPDKAESDVPPGYFGGKIKDGGKGGGKIKDGGREGGNGKKRSIPSDFDNVTNTILTLSHESRALRSTVTALLESSSSAVALGRASATADLGTLTISGDDVQKFKMIQDSVARAKRSTQNTHRTLQALAAHMQEETDVLTSAETFLHETISRWRRTG